MTPKKKARKKATKEEDQNLSNCKTEAVSDFKVSERKSRFEKADANDGFESESDI